MGIVRGRGGKGNVPLYCFERTLRAKHLVCRKEIHQLYFPSPNALGTSIFCDDGVLGLSAVALALSDKAAGGRKRSRSVGRKAGLD